MLKVEVETLSAIRRRLAIEVPGDQVAAEIERAYSGLRRQARIPGFRPGHAPRAVLERQFGDQVRGEVFNKLIQKSFVEAVRQEQMDVVGTPEIVTQQAEPGASLRFAATVEIYPEVEPLGYRGLEIQRSVEPVSDEDVERHLERLQDSLAQLRPVENRTAVESGDVVLIDYEGRIEDRLIARGERRPCEMGRDEFPREFRARLLGAQVGETLEFPVAYPATERNPDIAGKAVQFRVVIQGLAVKDVPPLDDEFAKDHGECDTLAQLRQRLRAQLEAAAVRQADERLRGAAVAKLVEGHPFELPESLVARRTEQLMSEVADDWRARRVWPKDEAAAFASLRDELTPRARSQVHATVVLDAIGRQEHIEVTDDDIEEEIERSAAAAGNAADRLRSLFARPEAREGLRERLRRQRVLDLVIDQARVTTVEFPPPNVAGEGESR